MKNVFTKIKLALIAMLFAFATKAQTSCGTAVVSSYPISLTATTYTASQYWFQVRLDSGSFRITIDNDSLSPNIIDSVIVYRGGTCGSLVEIQKDTVADTTNTIVINLYDTVTTTYFFKLYNKGTSSFKVASWYYCYIAGDMGFVLGNT